MSEEQQNSGESLHDTPEQQLDTDDAVLQELAVGHDQQQQQIAAMQARIDELEARLAAQVSGTVGSDSESENGREVEQLSDTARDLERLAAITGRPADDKELLKLHLRLKLDQFNTLTEAYDAQEGTVRQEGFMQDMATAKRELEEAMFLCDPAIRKVFEKQERVRLQLERTTDPSEKRRLMQELRRLKDHGRIVGNEQPRRDIADRFTDRLGDIASSLDGSEILATYELHKGEYPEDPISSRRRTDTVDWRGRPEYDENGVYIGSSPEKNEGRWVLEPKPPLESQDSTEPPIDQPPEPPKPPEPPIDTPPSEKVEVPPFNLGDYPELYARMKNLVGGDKEKLEAEAERVSQEIAANMAARRQNFLVENPNATPEQLSQFMLQCLVEAENKLQDDILAAIDGRGYTDAEGHEKGKSALRRFGAWMDRHGKALKRGMLIAGAVGVVGLTAGVAAGAIVPAFAIGAGTAWGAARGALAGLGMSRHGSKESASKTVDVTEFLRMSPEDQAKYASITDYLMDQFNKSADADHRTNVRRSAIAASIGALVGGIAGSISFNSPHTVSETHPVPNDPPEIPHHTIKDGELTGQVIQKTLNQMGLNGDRFVNPDGSTNLDLIVNKYFGGDWNLWHSVNALPNGTHSMAGADSMSNEGIKRVLETIVNNHDWGTHLEGSTSTQLLPNLPANIAAQISGLFLAGGLSRQAAESTRPSQRTQASASDSQTRPGPTPNPVIPPPVRVRSSQGEGRPEPTETTTGIDGPIDGGPVVTETSEGPEGTEQEPETYEFGGSANELNPNDTYGLDNGTTPNPIPVRFEGRDNRGRYVFRDRESGRLMVYATGQIEGPNGMLRSGVFKEVTS